MPWWRAIAVVAALVAVGSFAACGSDESSSSSPAKLTIETTDPSPDRVSLSAPKSIEAGEVEIELRNRGDMLHDAQLFRVDGERTGADIADALEAVDSVPRPRWLHLVGGVAPTRPGETATVTQVLEPGNYFVADTQERDDPRGFVYITNAAKKGVAPLEVVGDSPADTALPRTPATIVAREYGFETSGIVAGANRVRFRNAGKEAHQAVAFRIRPGAPFAVRRKQILDAQYDVAWVPIDVPHQRATTAMGGGGEQVTELTFRPGRYLLLCFVAGRWGGAPQWTNGMVSEVTVPPGPGR